MTFRDRLWLWAPWLTLAAVAAAYFPRFAKDPVGMAMYPRAAECLLRDDPVQQCEVLFTYPPLFALLMTPFVPLSMGPRNVLWYAVLVASVVGSFRLCEVLIRRLFPGEWNETEIITVRTVGLVLALRFILAVFENQSYDSLVLLLVLAGLVGMTGPRGWTAGLWFALAAALKTTPVIFLPYLLVKRRFAAAAVFIVVFGFVSLLPDLLFPAKGAGHYPTWVREVALGPLLGDLATLKHVFWVGPNPLNQSLRGAVGRIVLELEQPREFMLLSQAVAGVFIVAVGGMMLKSLRRDELIPLDGAALVIAMLMLSPMTSRSHYVALLLPYMLLAAAVWRGRKRALGIAVLTTSFVLATGLANDLVGPHVTAWSYRNSMPVLGVLVMLLYIGALIWSWPEADAQRVRHTNSEATT